MCIGPQACLRSAIFVLWEHLEWVNADACRRPCSEIFGILGICADLVGVDLRARLGVS